MAETLHLVCPHCATINRIPSPRLGETPKCGQCHNLIFTGHPIELGSGNFRKFIERNDVPVVVEFWAGAHLGRCSRERTRRRSGTSWQWVRAFGKFCASRLTSSPAT